MVCPQCHPRAALLPLAALQSFSTTHLRPALDISAVQRLWVKRRVQQTIVRKPGSFLWAIDPPWYNERPGRSPLLWSLDTGVGGVPPLPNAAWAYAPFQRPTWAPHSSLVFPQEATEFLQTVDFVKEIRNLHAQYTAARPLRRLCVPHCPGLPAVTPGAMGHPGRHLPRQLCREWAFRAGPRFLRSAFFFCICGSLRVSCRLVSPPELVRGHLIRGGGHAPVAATCRHMRWCAVPWGMPVNMHTTACRWGGRMAGGWGAGAWEQ